MSVRSHHWSADRHARKMRVLEFIQKQISTFPEGIDERTIIKVITKQLKTAPDTIRKYLSELEFEAEIEKRDGKFFPVEYENLQKMKEKTLLN